MPTPHVVLYTRSGCHLCDDALALLNRYGCRPTMVDIDKSPKHLAQFNECVPVIEIDGRIRFKGRVSAVLLRRLLAHANR
jgi:glutaredoxin